MVDAQVEVPPKAESRKGIQPVVELKVNGGVRAEVAVGQPVTFSSTIEVPPNTGKVVAAEWSFDGDGAYVPAELGDIKPAASVKATHSYSKPGTYFPVLRATSQREGDPKTQFGRIKNLGRARVVVKQISHNGPRLIIQCRQPVPICWILGAQRFSSRRA